jgi:hypothetical protein
MLPVVGTVEQRAGLRLNEAGRTLRDASPLARMAPRQTAYAIEAREEEPTHRHQRDANERQPPQIVGGARKGQLGRGNDPLGYGHRSGRDGYGGTRCRCRCRGWRCRGCRCRGWRSRCRCRGATTVWIDRRGGGVSGHLRAEDKTPNHEHTDTQDGQSFHDRASHRAPRSQGPNERLRSAVGVFFIRLYERSSSQRQMWHSFPYTRAKTSTGRGRAAGR